MSSDTFTPSRLLIVADDASAIGELLRDEGHEVRAVRGPDEVLESAGTWDPDVVITTIAALADPQWLTVLRERLPELALIVVSESGVAHAVDVCLRRPIDLPQLRTSLRRALTIRALQREVDQLRSRLAVLSVPTIPGSSMREIERYTILRTLEHVSGSTRKAAELLGISPRKIQYRLSEYRREREES